MPNMLSRSIDRSVGAAGAPESEAEAMSITPLDEDAETELAPSDGTAFELAGEDNEEDDCAGSDADWPLSAEPGESGSD
jgi:hypothetical protein